MLASVALRTMGSRRRSGLAFEGARAQPPVSGGALADLALGVQSRSEVGWIVSESPRLVCPSFADVLVGSEPPSGS